METHPPTYSTGLRACDGQPAFLSGVTVGDRGEQQRDRYAESESALDINPLLPSAAANKLPSLRRGLFLAPLFIALFDGFAAAFSSGVLAINYWANDNCLQGDTDGLRSRPTF